jgi:clan AA aspartic protease
MISGRVNSDIEAIIELSVVGPEGETETVEAVVDTGFSGSLTLPTSAVKSLQLVWLGREPAQLADGSTEFFDVFAAKVNWDGTVRRIEIQATEAQPLIGMSLLHRHSLKMDIVNEGLVEIHPMASM